MDIKKNVINLLESDKTNYRIAKDTGVANMTLTDLRSGKSELNNMKLGNAIKLSEYYIKIKGDIKMKTIFNTIEHNYKVNIDGRNATYYETKEDLLNEYKENEREVSELEYKFGVELEEVKFPVITFDEENSPDSGTLLDSTHDRDEVMSEVFEYFELLNDGECVWEYEEYNIFKESDVLRFEDKDSNVIGYVMLNENDGLIEELNKGVDPIAERREDGIGNEISLDGWSLD